MPMLNTTFKDDLTPEQKEAFSVLHKSAGWEVILKLAQDIIDQECDLEEVDENLPNQEYKTECLARKKAKQMFTRVFEDISGMATIIKKSKENYG